MNSSFLNLMKRIFFYSGMIRFRKEKSIMKPIITGLIIIAFVSFFVAGCNGNNSTNENKKKTDTVFVQPNNQGGEGMDGNHGGMGDDNKGTDSMHRSMEHGPRGMDTSHRKKHN